jgi:redox-sensitive bicupin YhaK (pirin superfamily)
MKILKANDRGLTQTDWLYSRHSFSFGDYYNPRQMGFRTLRVINDDLIAPSAGFGMHGHRDMEIITVMVEGELEHRDSLGHGEVLRPGEIQVMTAGRGIRHSEFNPSSTSTAHLIQIWIEPSQPGLAPAYQQRSFEKERRANTLLRIAGTRKEDDALPINQNANVYVATVTADSVIPVTLQAGRGLWIQLVQGICAINGVTVEAGDAISSEESREFIIKGISPESELLVFDLP